MDDVNSKSGKDTGNINQNRGQLGSGAGWRNGPSLDVARIPLYIMVSNLENWIINKHFI